jgi:hypothetical protein
MRGDYPPSYCESVSPCDFWKNWKSGWTHWN